jgi:hypothetical protein
LRRKPIASSAKKPSTPKWTRVSPNQNAKLGKTAPEPTVTTNKRKRTNVSMPEPNYFSDPKVWISVFSVFVAVWAAWNSTRSRRIALCAFELSEQQEKRRQPRIEIHFVDGFRKRLAEKDLFGFFIRVTNRSDTNNTISVAELQITYLLDGRIRASCRIPQAVKPEVSGSPLKNQLVAPLRIDAHQSIEGWVNFAVDRTILNGKTVDTQKLLLLDSNGICQEVEPIVIKNSP